MNLLTEIIDIINKQGLAIILAGLVVYFLWQGGQILLVRFRGQSTSDTIEISSHKFFEKVSTVIESDLSYLDIEPDFVRTIVQDMLVLFSKSLAREVQLFTATNYEKLSRADLKSRLTKLFNDIFRKQTQDFTEASIPPVISDYHRERRRVIFSLIASRIEDICESTYFATNRERINELLNLLTAIMSTLKVDTEQVFQGTDDRFYGITYKGITYAPERRRRAINHNFFYKVKVLASVDLPKIRMKNKCRQEILIQSTLIRWTAFQETFFAISEQNIDDITTSEFSSMLLMKIPETFAIIRKRLTESSIPEVVIDKMEAGLQPYNHLMLSIVEAFFNNARNKELNSRLYWDVLTVFEVLVTIYLDTARAIVDGLNGEMETITFMGEPCGEKFLM